MSTTSSCFLYPLTHSFKSHGLPAHHFYILDAIIFVIIHSQLFCPTFQQIGKIAKIATFCDIIPKNQ